MDGMQNDISQKFDNIQYSISRLTNLNIVQEKGRFPSQPHQNPKGVHEVESQEGESSQMKDVKALITLRSGKKIEKPTPKPHVEKEEEEIKKGEEMEDKESEISEKKKDYDSTMNATPEKELLKEEMLKKSISPPFPQALHGKKGIRNAAEILEVLRQVKVNIPLGLISKKAFSIEQVSAILQCKSPLKYKDPGSPTISVMIRGKSSFSMLFPFFFPLISSLFSFSITFWSLNYAYHISFQSLGSQESIASNGAQFGFETEKLWPFEDDCANHEWKCRTSILLLLDTFLKHFLELKLCITYLFSNLGKSGLCSTLLSHFVFSFIFISNKSNSDDVFPEDEWLGFLFLRVKEARITLNGQYQKALLDLGASVNLLPYSVYKQLGLGELKPTAITLSLADRSVKIPRGVIEDVLVQVDNFYYPVDFIVLDTNPTVKEANLVPIILGRPFLATLNAIINCRNGLMQLTFGNMTLDLNIFYMSKNQTTPEEDEGPEELCIIDTLVEEHQNQNMQDKLNESLADFEEGLSEPPNVLATLQSWKMIEEILPLFNKEEETTVEKETPKLNLKPLPVELKYTYLEENNQCPVVISSSLTSHQEKCLMEVLKRCISPLVCTHHIYMEEEAKPIRQFQRRLNPHLQEVVRAEKVEYCNRKDHFPLPFIDQVLERVSGHPFYSFLDGYSGYFQIEIDVEDQEKTIFTCPFGTYAYRRMPFGLCNAPATFQRYMLSIFNDMVEQIMEVFMDDIIVYGGTFEECLINLEAVLHRCIEKDLVLNWEKCHFIVRQGIVLGHIISEKGIEVDKAKVELIVKLPSPTTVKGVRQFLGHAGFYRRFIKGFSSLSKPLCELLAKDTKFIWDERCQNSFDQLKKFLTTTPIVRAPNWQLPFELMCDASDFAIGAVIGQREDGKPYVIYYASKTLNEAQRNYTTTEKELLAVVFALDKFCAYLVGSFITVFTDHLALKYLLTKQDAKARLIRWILLLQEFDLQIRDKKGVENVVADHLSRLVIAHNSHALPINDDFPKESLMILVKTPWYAHIANYLVTGEIPSEWNAQDRKHFFAKIHAYYWEEPFLFKYYADQIIRKCVLKMSNKDSKPLS
ncbi:hypothetical protein AAG906_001583 [Vitis piasezkii]